MKKLMLSVAALAMLAACGQSTEQAQAPAIELYAMDCGHTAFTDTDMFADDGSFAGQARELIVPCYLIRHPSGDLIWDTGLPDALADGAFTDPNMGATLSRTSKLADSLAQLNLTPADIEFVSFSHAHADHTGTGNLFTNSTWLANPDNRPYALDQPVGRAGGVSLLHLNTNTDSQRLHISPFRRVYHTQHPAWVRVTRKGKANASKPFLTAKTFRLLNLQASRWSQI